MENWRQFRDYVYEVSDQGRVRRMLDRTNAKAGAILRPQKAGRDYRKVTLCAGPVRDNFYVHRMVAESFLFHPPGRKGKGGFEINHKNGVKDDNRLANLEWVDHQGNVAHAVLNKRHPHGETHGEAKLTEPQVLEIRRRYATGEKGLKLLGREYGVTGATVGNIVHKRTWKHLLDDD